MSSDAVGPSLPAHVQKKSKRKRDDGVELKSSSGVDYSVVHTAPLVDARFERQMKARQAGKEQGNQPAQPSLFGPTGTSSATVDALNRMVLGKDARTIADKINDPHRPTWEQYKKENKDKLDLGNGEKQMMEYRRQLDEAREKALKKRSTSKKERRHSSSDTDDSSDGKRKPKKKSKKRKHKDRKKHKKRKRSSDSEDSDNDSDASSEKRSSRKKSKKKKKDSKGESSPVRLSSFFAKGDSEDSD